MPLDGDVMYVKGTLCNAIIIISHDINNAKYLEICYTSGEKIALERHIQL